MSIGRRLIDLVRSNINAVLDRPQRSSLEELSDEELEAELYRRHRTREGGEPAGRHPGHAQEPASRGADYSSEDWAEVEQAVGEGAGRYRTAGRRTGNQRRAPYAGGTPGAAGPLGREARLAQLYAQLECPYGADLTTVRKHYRALMRKYHPDMHAGSPEKQRLATDLSQRLTVAYNELRRLLGTSAA